LINRIGETVVAHRVTPGFFPSHFERPRAVEKWDGAGDKPLNEIRVKHRGECGIKKILAKDVVRFVFEFE